jgi:lipoate-protein ligase A
MLKKIGDTLFSTEFTYIDYLNHIVTDCVDGQIVEGGCPLEKCKLKGPIGLKELRTHFNEECTKIDMQCSNCKERMRRPFAKLHDCSDVYEKRLKEEQDKLAEAHRIIQEYEKKIKEKEAESVKSKEEMERMLTEAKIKAQEAEQK